MDIRIGNHVFPDQKTIDSLLKIGLVKEYDFSPEAREKHDEEMVFINGKKIKATREELVEYWKERFKKSEKKLREVQPNEVVVRPW